jgi:drug/metabolite transporter (DMT)-like permease
MKMHAHPPMLAFAAVSQYTGVALVLLMLVAGDQHGARALELPWHEFAMLLIFAVVGIGLGHTLYFHSIQRLGLAVSAGVTQLQPVTVSIGAIVLFPSETLTPGQWCAGALAIAGAVVMLVAQHRIAQRASLPLAPVEEQEAIASEAGRGA